MAWCWRCRSRPTPAWRAWAPSRRDGLIDRAAERRSAESYVERLRIKTPSVSTEVGALSGGNQQKVALARWLSIGPQVLILDEPTQGVDVGAKAEIHALIQDLAERGLAIIMISSELPEILGMSDRVVVMHAGTVSGVLSRSEATQDRILALALSAASRDAAPGPSVERLSRGPWRRLTGPRRTRENGRSRPRSRPGARPRRRRARLFLQGESERSAAGQSAGAARRHRHDAGHHHRRDRHLRRVDVCGVRGGVGDPREVGDADLDRGGRGLPVGHGVRFAERRARRLRRHPVDRRDAGDDDGAARRPALGDRRRLGAGPSLVVSMARTDPGSVSARRDRRRRR